MKILIVEDNEGLLESIADALVAEGALCETASTFEQSIEKVNLYSYDVLVIDINLPDGSGLNLIKDVKKKNIDAGIIVVTARNSLDDKIQGLNLGADDYITKPFHMVELVARTKALLRRKNFAGNMRADIGHVSIDIEKRQVFLGENSIELTKSEYEILLFFYSNKGRVLTKESIAEHIWGDNMDLADSFDFIYSHIKNLRKKLSNNAFKLPIKSVYGIGYKLEQ